MQERTRVQKLDGFVESEVERDFLQCLVWAYQMDAESWDGGEAQGGRGGADVSMLGGAGANLASAAEKRR